MGFDAGSAVEALDWTFRPFIDAEGTIPDPSERAVRTFFKVVNDLRKQGSMLTQKTDDEKSEDAERPDEVGERLNDQLLSALAELCGGSPSREQIEALPARQQIAFVDWLSKELVDPTRAAVTRPPLQAVR